ncbi:MAG: hypothetical protein CMA72_08485 [Euryarchaeota archaeon]|jgi:hypothetical protein|nr:hypothetical protein [Euryarchaeota archaeon]
MNSRMKAETTRVCDAGLSAYLADKHSEFRLRSFSRGVVGGAILTLPTYFLVQSTGINPIFSILPLASGLLGGTWTGLTQADRADGSNSADFDEVCATLEESESDEDSEDSEDSN